MLNKLLVLFFLITCSVQSSEKINIAVLDFKVRGSVSTDEVKIITDRFQTELINSKKFSVLERNQVDQILEEQGFQNSGACSSNDCQIEVGQMLGVDQLIAGSIGKLGNLFTVNLKVIDVETAEIVASYASDYRNGLEEVLLTGCREMAYVVSTGGKSLVQNDGMHKTKTPQQRMSEEEGHSLGWWIAGGVVAVGGVVVYLFLSRSEPSSSASAQEEICRGPESLCG